MSRRARLAAAVLALAVLGGAAWLVHGVGSPEMVAVFAHRLAPAELAAARAALRSNGIDHRTQAGRILVPRGLVGQARAVLSQAEVSSGDAASSFERLTSENAIWRTAAQEAKRWQAAKMATLSELIANFPSVRSATVLFEPGSPRRLGTPAVEPTAAVNVTLQDGAKMTQELVGAIADQVAASVTGMRRENVRIVDSAGRSFRARQDAAAGDAFDSLRAAEGYYREAICASLHYIRDVAVGVHVVADAGGARCLGASVSVPRSYLAAVYRAQQPSRPPPSDAEIRSVTAVHLSKVQQAVAKIIGCKDPSAVTVDWHYDVSVSDLASGQFAADPSEGAARPAGWGRRHSAALAIAGGLAVGCLTWGVLILRRRAARAAAAAERAQTESPEPAAADDKAPPPPQQHDELLENPFGFLQDAPREEVVALIADEHPQTIALVLGHLSPARAASILAALPPARQVEVGRRVAELGPVDPHVLRDVQRDLSARLVKQPAGTPARPGGVAKIAEILHYAGYATEKKVLDGLSDQQPALAESIRTRMFVFEDISRMPAGQLRGALEMLETEELAIALRTAADPLKKKVLSSLSAASARQVREEMDGIGPVRLSDVEAAQQRVMDAIRRAERGEYVGVLRESPNEVLA